MPCTATARALGASVIAAAAFAAPVQAGFLTDWNLICRGNFVSTSEIDGSAIIGGTLSGNSNNFAVQGVTAPGNVGLAVGGAISGNQKQVNNGGHLRYASTGQNLVNVNGAGQRIFDATVPAQVTALMAQATTLSAQLAALAPNSSVVVANNNGAFNSTPTTMGGFNVAVFSISAASIDNLASVSLSLGAANSIIINVVDAGAVSIVAPPNFLDQFNQANSSRILWNFPSATSLTIGGGFNGAVLAPGAALTLSSGAINGAVVVDSVPSQNAEIRRFTYTGFVPTPGAAGLLALAGVAAPRRRRREPRPLTAPAAR